MKTLIGGRAKALLLRVAAKIKPRYGIGILRDDGCVDCKCGRRLAVLDIGTYGTPRRSSGGEAASAAMEAAIRRAICLLAQRNTASSHIP